MRAVEILSKSEVTAIELKSINDFAKTSDKTYTRAGRRLKEGKKGDIYSLGEVVFNKITPFCLVLGFTDIWHFFISHDHVMGFFFHSPILFFVQIYLFYVFELF